MTKQFTLLTDHTRRTSGQGGAQIMPLEFLMRSCHARPSTHRLDRDIDGQALNYVPTTRQERDNAAA